MNDIVTAVNKLQRVGVLCCIGVFLTDFSISTSIWPPSSREGCVVDVIGYTLCGQDNAHPPCPRGCRGASGSRNWVYLCGGGCCASTLNQETCTETERPEGPSPSKPLHRTIHQLSRHRHSQGTASIRCLPVPRLASPPAQFQYAAKTGVHRIY